MRRGIDATDLIEFASDPAFGLNSEMRVTGWNDGAEELLGYSPGDAVGKKCGAILQASYNTGEPLCSMLCEGRSCITSGEKWGIGSCKIRHKNGEMVNTGISSLVLPRDARNDNQDDTVAVIFLRQANGELNDASAEAPLRIFSLGQFGLAVSGKGLNVENWKRKQAARVLKCLVCHIDRPVHRERLIEWLWPEASSENGWQRLKVTISYLRGELRKGGARRDVIETVGQSYLLRRDAVWVDCEVFCTLVAAGHEQLKAGNLIDAQLRFEEAESLYRGDLFEDEPYVEWCAVERERLREIYLEMLTGLASCYSQLGKFVEASRICRTALSTDPSRENFVRVLMENLVSLERPDWARAYFISWRKSLEKEYGLQPTRETVLAYRQLTSASLAEVS